jgi:hypothetical protein
MPSVDNEETEEDEEEVDPEPKEEPKGRVLWVIT